MPKSPSVPPVGGEHSLQSFTVWLEFEHWVPGPGDNPRDGFFNMVVKLADGTRYALNVWTFDFLDRARRDTEPGFSAESNGTYLVAPDLFVERLDRSVIECAVAHLLATGQMKDAWRVVDSAGD